MIIVIVVLSLFVSFACGTSNEDTVVTPRVVETTEESPGVSEDSETLDETQEPESSEVEEPAIVEETEEPSAAETEEAPTKDVFEVGDLIEVKEHSIRLNSVEYQGDMLIANFSIENKGDSDLNVSSMMSFSAKKEDGTKLEQEIFDCGESGLDGTVLPGDKLRGSICWSGGSPDDGVKIYYQANLVGEGAVVWNAIEGTAEPLDIDTPSSVETFQVGDLVEIEGHTIRVNSIEYQGDVLVVNFSVENRGDSDVGVSSMMSFSAKRQDGTKLEQEIFDCGVSGLDGSVLPGDRLRGNICWSEASPDDGIRIYYEASAFGEGAVVWDAVPGEVEPIIESDIELKVDTFKVGDVVQVNEHTVVLNEATFEGEVLKANFTIENQGDSDVSVSSMMSFSARKRDGSQLEQEIFNCGSSLDGDVLPGDKLRGDVCWSGASPDDEIKIYYEADLFGQGSVVWVLE